MCQQLSGLGRYTLGNEITNVARGPVIVPLGEVDGAFDIASIALNTDAPDAREATSPTISNVFVNT